MHLGRLPQAYDQYAWRSLTVFNFYRFLVAAGMVGLTKFGIAPEFLGTSNPPLFYVASISYLLASLLNMPLLYWRRPSYRSQVLLMVILDIIAITLTMHASGGPGTGLGMLLAVSVTIACLLLGTRTSMAVAAFAAIAVISEQSFAYFSLGRDGRGFTQAAILGAIYLALAALALMLARRLTESEAAAADSRANLAKMERLNEHIIQYMNTGVLAIDRSNHIQMINHAAWTMLGMPQGPQNKLLDDVSMPLAKQLRQWRRGGGEAKISAFRVGSDSASLLPTFNSLSSDHQLTIVFLEDTSRTMQQATQMKLASLGRLTASIAHEIRNPLGALSHASQLLRESHTESNADTRLIDIIEKNCARMNGIIENILQISQRRPSQPEALNLTSFIHGFLDDFRVGRNPAPEIRVEISPAQLSAHFDPGQLTQVLTNLCENGLRYSKAKINRALLELHAGEDKRSGRAFLDVIDYGEGINPDIAEKMFEPFFTTSSKGLGLGLYLARELCQANRAHLQYVPVPSGGTCFRIIFTAINKTIPQP